MSELFFLYGPPGSGKSSLGSHLGDRLDLPFFDLDLEVQQQAGQSITAIFEQQGEAGFRSIESACLKTLLERRRGVVALGGGTLLAEENRRQVESAGAVLCLHANPHTLLARLQAQPDVRPLLGGGEEMLSRLAALLEKRASHYASFALRLDTSNLPNGEPVALAQAQFGAFRICGMGSPYDVRIQPGGLDTLGELMQARGLKGPLALACDGNIVDRYAARAEAILRNYGYDVSVMVIPPGEVNKTMQTVAALWQGFLSAGLERSSTVVALGGGVTGDLAGFAAATYLLGVRWVAAPTTLLAMVDASLGGKTGADLPQGKNLVGAFHPPALVLADPALLDSLPEVELRNGLAEVVKHGILADADLFSLCGRGWAFLQANDWTALVRRAMAVKVDYIQADPYEQGLRAALNLGHTVGHALEVASGYALRHGEAVAIGLVIEARLAEQAGIAEKGLSDQIAAALASLGLPTRIPPGIERAHLAPIMLRDKKKAGGKVHFALPTGIGKVRTGIALDVAAIDWTEVA
ncbi:MAG: 3-dehydroquinate synthase [Anaerolineaceae bacterium]